MGLSATIELDQASGRIWDAVVIGAGPAGAMTAYELARRSAAVLLVDKATFPRWKVCGSCLSGAALDVLQAAGLGALPSRLGAIPLHAMHWANQQCVARLPLPNSAAISREAFDAALVQEAMIKGASFLPCTRAARIGGDESLASVQLESFTKSLPINARVVISAGGLAGHPSSARGLASSIAAGSRLGAGALIQAAPVFYEPGIIYMANAAEGYLGLVRLEDGRLDAATALDSTFVKACGGLGAAAERILALSPWPKIPGIAALSWRGTPHLTRRSRQLGGPRVFSVGDATGYVEPFTGEGIAWAILSATALAPIALEGIRHWRPDLVQTWARTHRGLLGPRQTICRLIARGLRSPKLAGSLVWLLSQWPILAQPLIQHLNRSPKLSWEFPS